MNTFLIVTYTVIKKRLIVTHIAIGMLDIGKIYDETCSQAAEVIPNWIYDGSKLPNHSLWFTDTLILMSVFIV